MENSDNSIKPDIPFKPPIEPLKLKNTRIKPVLLVVLFVLGFAGAAGFFAVFSASRVRKQEAKQSEIPVATPSVVEIIPMPEPPQQAPKIVQQEEKPVPLLKLSGILFGKEGSLALINGKIRHEGQEVEGAILEKIYSDRVELSFEGKKILIRSK